MKKIYTLILLLFSITIYAQVKTISGLVSDDLGPVSDISVKVKGAERGTVTDFDGKFSIKANLGETLEFSHISYKTQEKIIRNDNIIITLSENGYYVMTIYQKEPKYFLTIDYYSDLKNKTNGFLANLYLPKILKKVKPQFIFGLQKDKDNQSKIVSEIKIENLFKIKRKKIDVNLSYNKVDLKKIKYTKQLIETQFSKRIVRQYFGFYIGFGNISLNNQTNVTYEIGINKRILNLFHVYSKTTYLMNSWQFQNGLNMYYKGFNFQAEYNQIKKHNEFNLAIGYLFKF